MLKKSVLVLSLLIIASLCLGPAARAQSPGMAGQAFRPSTPAAPPGQAARLQPAQPAAGASVPLGDPGTVFRYVKSLGVTGQPYKTDSTHLNRPRGMFMDGSGNLFVTEEQGKRVLKYGPTGAFQWAIGGAGVCITDQYLFCTPNDVSVDAAGHVWVADGNRVVEYSATGSFMQQFPVDQPWNPGPGNDRFDQAQGLAFDGAGRLYVSDSNNQRIQVFDMTSGSPVYSTTLGTTGTQGNGTGQFSDPHHIAIDLNDRLLVADRGNNRVQACTYSAGWTCSTLDGGLNFVQGVTVDGANNVFISDSENNRIRKCTAGGCSNFATNAGWFDDLAVDAAGNVYGSDPYPAVVRKFNSSGVSQGNFLGVEMVPYLTDMSHYHHARVAVDKDNNIILVEEAGQRLLKLDSTGKPLWSFGVPGVDANDDSHLMWSLGVATDLSGKIYVANNSQVKIFTPAGALSATFGDGFGAGNYTFGRATGIAVGTNGTIYVADGPNHRVQVYNSSHVYVTRLGETGVPGSDDAHFVFPLGLAVDATNNLYVVDPGNCRVQKFNSSLVYQATFGTGCDGSGLTDISSPNGVAVDVQGRVYVSEWNSRVTVFDSSGAYLTTLGGTWGFGPTQFTGATSVAVDSYGNVLISDNENARIQEFAPGVAGWKQINLNGFGQINNNAIWSLGIFTDTLYAGTANFSGGGAQIWKLDPSAGWVQVMAKGFGDTSNAGIDHMLAFKGSLYASTMNCYGSDCSSTNGGQIWRSSDAVHWDPITTDAFGSPSMGEIFRLAVLEGQICASTWDYGASTTGTQIWCSPFGDAGTWAKLADNGFGNSNNVGVMDMLTYDGSIFAGTMNMVNGSQVWRKTGSGGWTQVNTNGFGDTKNTVVTSLQLFGGQLYAMTRSNTLGDQVFRCTLCDNTDWQEVGQAAFNDPAHKWTSGLAVVGGKLYATLSNQSSGVEVWQTTDGQSWRQTGWAGLGDPSNMLVYWGNAVLAYQGKLTLGTMNYANGGEVWQAQETIYVPVVRK